MCHCCDWARLCHTFDVRDVLLSKLCPCYTVCSDAIIISTIIVFLHVLLSLNTVLSCVRVCCYRFLCFLFLVLLEICRPVLMCGAAVLLL